jgi:hypothetical protein
MKRSSRTRVRHCSGKGLPALWGNWALLTRNLLFRSMTRDVLSPYPSLLWSHDIRCRWLAVLQCSGIHPHWESSGLMQRKKACESGPACVIQEWKGFWLSVVRAEVVCYEMSQKARTWILWDERKLWKMGTKTGTSPLSGFIEISKKSIKQMTYFNYREIAVQMARGWEWTEEQEWDGVYWIQLAQHRV